jgi:hypothetical protein
MPTNGEAKESRISMNCHRGMKIGACKGRIAAYRGIVA